MSDWISDCVSARLYARTSSIWPANHSAQTLLPPIRSTPVEEIVPATTAVPDGAPLT